MKTLPNIPSELLSIALEDLKLCEKDPDYKIEMNAWHNWESRKKVCYVCLAGAFLAKSHAFPKNQTFNYTNIGNNRELDRQIHSLNMFRCGFIGAGLSFLNIVDKKGIMSQRVTDYSVNPSQFKKDIVSIISTLKKNNL